MSNGSFNLMLDPSMFFTVSDERTLDVMMNRISRIVEDGAAIHVPQAFMTFVEDAYIAEADGGDYRTEQFVNTYAPEHHPLSFERLYKEMSNRVGLIQTFSPGLRLREKHNEFRQGLDEVFYDRAIDDPRVSESVLQEWIFLQERSWIVSQTREAFDLMRSAGAEYLEFGRSALDRLGTSALDNLNKVVRKTRGKAEEEAITPIDRLLTLGKWVAAGGGAVAAGGIVSLPPALAIMIAISPRFFALIDP
ncbi:MAG: hypothetical protein M3198_09695 [Actinomycetota bacterium]|nr:hypothetical protein [Actinomycetota bacterium]